VTQGSECPGFPPEVAESLAVLRKRVGQYLDGNLSAEIRVGSPIDLTHSARADLTNHFISPTRVPGWSDILTGGIISRGY
jgi:hypothetical protein